MKRVITLSLLIAGFFSINDLFAQVWQTAAIVITPKNNAGALPKKYSVYTTDEAALKAQLFALPNNPAADQLIKLPMPDGTIKQFRVWSTPLLPAALAAKYPGLKTFTAEAAGDRNITAKLDITDYGFHAVIFNGNESSFIDQVSGQAGYYLVHARKDEVRQGGGASHCEVAGKKISAGEALNTPVHKAAGKTSNGYTLRTYRLALACDHQYAQVVTGVASPTIAQVLSKMTTTMNRVNGVYEREVAVTMAFTANEDMLIWPTATGSANGADPFDGIDGDAGACLSTNQTVCDDRIGTANYDIGHVFTTGAGGLSQIGVICDPAYKAQSVTGLANPSGDGFDIDYVAHEMGHEYGADHPFNNSRDGSCGNGNINEPTAYEPGSGSTIMAYAGICSPDDLQPHSDPYFHAISLQQIHDYITVGGDGCAVKTPTSNKLVNLPPFMASYTIPYLTPFELTAPDVTDSVADSPITYCWEQWNLGDVGAEFKNTHVAGPIFRSYLPTLSATRVFPRNDMVLAGMLSNAGTENAEGEKAPDVARYLTFRLTMRDIYQGTGCFLIADDTVHLDAINTGTGFAVTSQSTPDATFIGNSSQKITWDVAKTNVAPINTANVDIYMSADGGDTWAYHIGNFINNGSAIVKLPNPDSAVTHARIKVKGSGNVFFNVNSADFAVTHGDAADTVVKLYPVPARSSIRLSPGNGGILQVTIFNAVGQLMYKGEADADLDIAVNLWARGLYVMKLTDIHNGHTIKKFVVE